MLTIDYDNIRAYTNIINGLILTYWHWGTDIHIFGRVVSLADVFDALTHARCYKKAWEVADVIAYIEDHRGTQFDPELVDIFLEHVDEFKAIV
jgi:putative two-component system response regulator